MKFGVTIGLLGLLSICIEAIARHIFLPAYLTPHIMILIVVYMAFFEVGVYATVTAFLLGLLMDFASAGPIGPWAGAFVSTYGCLAVFSQRLFIDSPLVAMVVGFGSSVFSDLLYFVLLLEFRPIDLTTAGEIITKAIVTALVAPFIFAALKGILGRRAGGGRSLASAN